jgi:hypothetical protein
VASRAAVRLPDGGIVRRLYAARFDILAVVAGLVLYAVLRVLYAALVASGVLT